MAARARRQLPLLLALLLSAGALAYQRDRQRVGYTRYDLPTYDAFVYVTMAEEPAFFTAAPWGYRVLLPLLVHQVPPRQRLAAFKNLSYWSLVCAGGLLFLFLVRLGHSRTLSLVGVLAFCLSSPVRLALATPMFGEALAVALLAAALLAVAARAPLAVVAGLLAAGVLVKELFLLLPPLVLLARLPREGLPRAARAALLAAAPVWATHLLLRAWWTPGLRVPHAPFDLELLRVGLDALAARPEPTVRALLLAGVLPLAVLGAARREARPYLAVFGYLALASVALSLLAWVNVPSPVPVPLFGANTERILIYALPLLIPLALVAIARALGLRPPRPRAERAARSRAALLLGAAACCGCLALPFLALDRYRRLPLHGSRDGPLVMAFCRESLRVARSLERGEQVLLEPGAQSFSWGVDDPGRLYRMRWFLRDGWGPLPHYARGDALTREPRATLVLPCLRPRALSVTLALASSRPATLRVYAGSRLLGSARSGPETVRSTLRVPGEALFRGDNLLTLVAAAGEPVGVRLESYELGAAP